MDEVKHQPLVVERTFNAPVDKVWKAITDKNQIREWFFDIKEFNSNPDLNSVSLEERVL